MKNGNPYSLTVTAIAIIAIALLLQQSCNGNKLIKSIISSGITTKTPQRVVKTVTESDTIILTEYVTTSGTSTVSNNGIPDTIYIMSTDSIKIFDTIKLISYCTDTITITDSSIISKDSLIKVTLTDKITLNNIISRKYNIQYNKESIIIKNNTLTEITESKYMSKQIITPMLLYQFPDAEFGVGIQYNVSGKRGYGITLGMGIINANVQLQTGFCIPVGKRR